MTGLEALKMAAVAARAAAAADDENDYAAGFASGLANAVNLLIEAEAELAENEVRPDGPETAKGGLIGQEPY